MVAHDALLAFLPFHSGCVSRWTDADPVFSMKGERRKKLGANVSGSSELRLVISSGVACGDGRTRCGAREIAPPKRPWTYERFPTGRGLVSEEFGCGV
ncbi:hypothetical protein CYMTET_4274 [Cymbomonas tetramitiformis]|uniref:Uncharacterized protein n=1 Tax=Cymbomonas tetramitiformis TaxID=36881 RepID=A0AAE0H3A3_9CHLO|nr:hypothetical protein CYMTET_4274 [Cymbomonas tetramitiformis]